MAATDLAALMQVDPAVAAGFIGANQAQDQQTQGLKQQELAQLIQSRQGIEQRLQELQPYNVQKADLDNQTTAAALPGVTGQAQSRAAAGTLAQASLPSGIDLATAQNRMNTYKAVMEHLGSIGSDLGDGSQAPQHAVLAQRLSETGLPQKLTDGLMQRYANVPPAQLQQALAADAAKVRQENDRYQQAVDVAGIDTTARSANVAATNAKDLLVADKNNEGRITAAGLRAQRLARTEEERIGESKTAMERFQRLQDAATRAHLRMDDESAQEYLQRASALRPAVQAELNARAGARGGTPDVGAVSGLPMNAGPQAPMPGLPGQATPQATPQAAPPPVPAGSAQRITVIAPDGRRGNIPAGQLQQALQQGYRQAQ